MSGLIVAVAVLSVCLVLVLSILFTMSKSYRDMKESLEKTTKDYKELSKNCIPIINGLTRIKLKDGDGFKGTITFLDEYGNEKRKTNVVLCQVRGRRSYFDSKLKEEFTLIEK